MEEQTGLCVHRHIFLASRLHFVESHVWGERDWSVCVCVCVCVCVWERERERERERACVNECVLELDATVPHIDLEFVFTFCSLSPFLHPTFLLSSWNLWAPMGGWAPFLIQGTLRLKLSPSHCTISAFPCSFWLPKTYWNLSGSDSFSPMIFIAVRSRLFFFFFPFPDFNWNLTRGEKKDPRTHL